MPNRTLSSAEAYRYAYQGQEKDSETGKEAFELRLWDSRIGRWLTTDPKHAGVSPYWGMNNNPLTIVDPDGGEGDDWYEILDADGNGTGEYEWFDGCYDIVGYKHIGLEVSHTYDLGNDEDGFRITKLVEYRKDKKSYVYNSETGKYDFLKNYDNSSLLMNSIVNPIMRYTDQVGKSLVNGFQGVGIALYEQLKGNDVAGTNLTDFGYKPALNIESTLMYNNGKWVKVNLHSQGMEVFARRQLIDTYSTLSKGNLPNNVNRVKKWFGW